MFNIILALLFINASYFVFIYFLIRGFPSKATYILDIPIHVIALGHSLI